MLVLQGGRVVHKRGYGVVDADGDHEPDADTRFELASVSKQFTAMAIMMLAERGELDDVYWRMKCGNMRARFPESGSSSNGAPSARNCERD